MGLDMYLMKKKRYPRKEIAYWRKANHIHKWFVDHVQGGEDDCGDYEVTKEQLEELLNTCRTIKEEVELIDGKVEHGQQLKDGHWEPILEDGKVIANPQICKDLLPRGEGYFFGGYNYDDDYMDAIDDTIEQIEYLMKKTDWDKEIVEYTSSW